jgi:hypothetical protein
MAAFRIELLYRTDDHREPSRAECYNIHAPDLDATVVQARALFRALSSGKPSLVRRLWGHEREFCSRCWSEEVAGRRRVKADQGQR